MYVIKFSGNRFNAPCFVRWYKDGRSWVGRKTAKTATLYATEAAAQAAAQLLGPEFRVVAAS